MAHAVLDTKGLNCPLPVLKARRALRALKTGDELQILATDPAAVQDFAAFAESAGHVLLESRSDGGTYIFVLRKGGEAA
jgi:tRNA 2-thiouridine synthesizing protein A